MLNSLQAFRGLAAIGVVLHHTNIGIFSLEKYFGHRPLGCLVDFAYAGVDFFFVLCGFIMLHVHADEIGQPRALGSYLWKRFSRIYLLYWVVLAVVATVFFVAPHFGTGVERDPAVILRNIVLFPFPYPEYALILGVAWTLVYEILFYLLFGLLILNKRLGVSVFVLWTCFVLAHRCFDAYPWNFLFSHHHIRFLAGMAVWLILHRWRVPVPRLVAGIGVTFFLAAGLVEDFAGPMSPTSQMICFTLGSAVTILGLVEAERSGLMRTPRCLVYLGDASYSIYLVHVLALSLIAKVSKSLQLDAHVPSLMLFSMHVVGAVGVGCPCHHVIEHPLHVWARRRLQRPRPVAIEEAAPGASIRKAA